MLRFLLVSIMKGVWFGTDIKKWDGSVKHCSKFIPKASHSHGKMKQSLSAWDDGFCATPSVQVNVWLSLTAFLGHRGIATFSQNHNTRSSGPWFNIEMSSYQYRKYHCGDKTVVRSSYLHNGISYTGKMSSLYWIGALVTINFKDKKRNTKSEAIHEVDLLLEMASLHQFALN